MKQIKIVFFVLMLVFGVSSFASAGDFDWIKDFDIQARLDPSGLKTKLGARFQVGDLKINTVLSNAETPSDAYMMLRLGEISKQPVDKVIDTYKTQKNKGWGTMARSLGIKPGSKEFHALKNGQDLYSDRDMRRSKRKDRRDKSKGKDQGNKGKGKY